MLGCPVYGSSPYLYNALYIPWTQALQHPHVRMAAVYKCVLLSIDNPAWWQVDVHNNLGDLWRAQGQVGRQAAQQCYSEALRIDNTYAPAWRGLGDMFRENSEHQQAVTCYQVGTLPSPLLGPLSACPGAPPWDFPFAF